MNYGRYYQRRTEYSRIKKTNECHLFILNSVKIYTISVSYMVYKINKYFHVEISTLIKNHKFLTRERTLFYFRSQLKRS